jgi:hypothetical protein
MSSARSLGSMQIKEIVNAHSMREKERVASNYKMTSSGRHVIPIQSPTATDDDDMNSDFKKGDDDLEIDEDGFVRRRDMALAEEKIHRFILKPGSSRKFYWDLLIMVLIIYLCFSLPFQLAFWVDQSVRQSLPCVAIHSINTRR